MVLLFENGFSGWGQFLQSFCRSTSEFVILRVAKREKLKFRSQLCILLQFEKFENCNSKIILQFRTGNYITHVWFLVGRLDHYLAIRSDHPLPMAYHTIRLHFSDLQSHYGQFLEISSIIIKKKKKFFHIKKLNLNRFKK